MALYSQSISNLINGISQQTATQRNETQAELQENAQSRIVEGLSKRPSLEYVATLDATKVYPTNAAIHGVQRDANTAFISAFTNGAVKVWSLAGVAKTVNVPNGVGYLASTNPKEHLKFVTVADFTFVVNTSIIPLMASATSAAKIERTLVYLKQSNYGNTYSITLAHPDIAYDIKVALQMPSGSSVTHDAPLRDTVKMADILAFGTGSAHWNSSSSAGFIVTRTDTGATLSTTQGLKNLSTITDHFTTALYDSTIDIKPTDGDVLYSVSTADGFGGTAMYGVRDEIQDFTNLPFYSPVDAIIKVTGDEGDTLSDYYVKFESEGVWKEVVGPGVKLGFDATKMPHALVNNNDGTFTFKQLVWESRISGDEETNPDPTFIGKTINNITFYKNRLGVLSEENVIFTESGKFFNFFKTTGTASLDTDSIDIAASSTQVSTLKHAIAYNEQLLLFSGTNQFVLRSASGTLTPKTASITSTTTFEHNEAIPPISVGNYVYFVQNKGNFSAMREYYADDDTSTNDSVDITSGVSSYIPSNLTSILGCPMEDSILVLPQDIIAGEATVPYTVSSNVAPTNGKEIYIYKYFWDANEKVQASWSKWIFDGVQILGGVVIESVLYLIANDLQDCRLYKIDLQNSDDSNLSFSTALDHKTTLSGSYSAGTGKTTYTSPYGERTGLFAVDAATGVDLTLTNSGATYYAEGSHTSAIFGTKFTTKYQFSPVYVRENSTSGGRLAITSGRLQVRTVSIDYENTGFFQVEVAPTDRDLKTYTMNGQIINDSSFTVGDTSIVTGTFSVPVQAQNTAYTLTIKSDSYLPMHVVAAEIESFYHRRSAR
jgi:hypothetical protein